MTRRRRLWLKFWRNLRVVIEASVWLLLHWKGVAVNAELSDQEAPEFRGCHGGELHESMVDDIRFDVANMLRFAGLNLGVVVSEPDMNRVLGGNLIGKDNCSSRAKRVADVVFMDDWQRTTSIVVVEVGRFNPDKWPSSQPVLHVGFDGQCALINPTGHWFESMVRDHVDDWFNGQ